MLEIVSKYAPVLSFYLPLGVIGVWRWSVWLIRKIISLFYKSPGGDFAATLSIITPVYNENSHYFKMALESWKRNSPDEIIAVIDHTDGENIKIFEEFAGAFLGARLIVTTKPGKRPALADGIRASLGEIVALVDSDTIWSEDIKTCLLGVFSDPEVGGAVTRQDVLETDTLARKLFKILLDDRYLLEYPFLATVSDALLCLSGRTAIYRKSAVLDKLNELENETFWGDKVISGDDKTLTHLIQKDGWKSRYLRNVKVYTTGTGNIGNFLKQKLRWTRNGLRSDGKALFSGWVWKNHKILALHMLDKFISPITLLLAPIYFGLAIYFGHWEIALLIAVWWIVSRAVKIYPHLKEKPADVFILPAYVLMTFLMAVVKLYAFITLNEQGWITRWHKSRLKSVHFLKKALSYAATAAVIFGLSFSVFSYEQNVLARARLEKQRAMERESIFTLNTPRLSNVAINQVRTSLLAGYQSDPFGYYAVKTNDTVSILRDRYNVRETGQILNARTKSPISNFSPLAVGQQVAIPIGDLQVPLSSRELLAGDLFQKPPVATYDRAANTIYVRQGGSLATLGKISQALGPAGANLIQEVQSGEWILKANLYIGKNVTLILSQPEVAYLKLKSDSEGFVWVRSESGGILVENTKITSWDEKNLAVDTDVSDGRAYLTARSDGRMDILNSELAYLGYVGSPKRGGPFGGSYGVSWKISDGRLRNTLLTGVVLGSKFHNNLIGLYTFGATGMLIRGNEFYDNTEYGLDPHDDSNNMFIENNTAYRNGRHGIILSKRCFGNIIRNNISYENKLNGIMLDRASNNNLVENNTVYGNSDGIVLYDSRNNLILTNTARDNLKGIRINQNSSNNYFENNIMADNSRGVYVYNGANKNMFIRNEIRGSDIGITIKNASQNVLYDNFETGANRRAGRITPDSRENDIR